MFRSTVVAAILSMLSCVSGCHRAKMFLGVEREEQISGSEFSDVPQVRCLAVAVDRDDAREIAAAVAAGADVNAFGRCGFRVLDWAFVRNKPIAFRALLEQGADIMADYRDPRSVPDASFNSTILRRVLEADRPDFIETVLGKGMHPDHVPFPEDGRSLLSFAVASRETHVLTALLDAGASVNRGDRWGSTALHDARSCRNYKAAWLLMQRGADPAIKDSWGKDFVWGLKEFGSRGVQPDQREYFEKVVDELVRRGLLTWQDIVEADKPKTPNSGITVIEHSPGSEAGQAILELDQAEREYKARINQ